MTSQNRLWFDVGIKRYTTLTTSMGPRRELWFDVGIKRYTTQVWFITMACKLWFDVGIKRYTTCDKTAPNLLGCGLM